jgi:hypothetical protein
MRLVVVWQSIIYLSWLSYVLDATLIVEGPVNDVLCIDISCHWCSPMHQKVHPNGDVFVSNKKH